LPLRVSIRAPRGDITDAGSVPAQEVEVAFADSVVVFGRAQGADIQLPFPEVSARHARLWRQADGYRVEDLGSSNGTRLGGRRLAAHAPEPFAIGETITLGGVEVRFIGETPPAEAVPAGAGTDTLARRLVHDVFTLCPDAERARLVVLSGAEPGREFVLPASGRTCKLGRGEGCDWVLADEDVSREHAAFVRDERGVTIRDLGSKNGVEVAGERLMGERLLHDGEVVRVGETRLRLLDPEDRYLRQMAAAEAEPSPVENEAIQGCASSSRVILPAGVRADSPVPPSRLPMIASAIAVTVLALAVVIVLALVFGS
jgi:pSer/pThr/pTyr-binding forkhead associated (FHA) protein